MVSLSGARPSSLKESDLMGSWLGAIEYGVPVRLTSSLGVAVVVLATYTSVGQSSCAGFLLQFAFLLHIWLILIPFYFNSLIFLMHMHLTIMDVQ